MSEQERLARIIDPDAFNGDAAFESMLMPEQIERELGDRRRRSLAKADLILARPPDWTDEEVERAARAIHLSDLEAFGLAHHVDPDLPPSDAEMRHARAAIQSLRPPVKGSGE